MNISNINIRLNNNDIIEVPGNLAPIFLALTNMDINLKQIVKKCDPTIRELQWIIDLEKKYELDQESKLEYLAS